MDKIEGGTAERLTEAIKKVAKAMQDFSVTAKQASRLVFPQMRPPKRKKVIRLKR